MCLVVLRYVALVYFKVHLARGSGSYVGPRFKVLYARGSVWNFWSIVKVYLARGSCLDTGLPTVVLLVSRFISR